MTQQQTYDCRQCPHLFECTYRGAPSYCPLEEEEQQRKEAQKKNNKPYPFWGQSNK